MKKLLLLLALGLFSSWIIGQEVYLGAAEPENFNGHVSHHASSYYAPNLTCPPGALNENEPDLTTGDLDTVNGGCNSYPPVFIDINIGDKYCGRTNTYLYNSNRRRDTDWYRITLTDTKTLIWRSIADCEVNLIILREDGGCSTTTLNYTSNVPAGTQGEVVYTCTPGTYYFWIGYPDFSGLDAGADYQVTLLEPTSQVPLSDWAVYLTIGLIFLSSIYFVNKRIA